MPQSWLSLLSRYPLSLEGAQGKHTAQLDIAFFSSQQQLELARRRDLVCQPYIQGNTYDTGACHQ